MRKLLILALLCPLFCLSQGGIGNKAIAPLSIGDTLSATALHYIRSASGPLRQSRDTKLYIIDFFATWCGSCLKSLPKFDTLQARFGSAVQLTLVAYESPARLAALRKTNKRFAGYSFPLLAADTLLHRLFPHRLLPHTVWLNSAGKVLAITDAQEVTAAAIETVIREGHITLPLKEDAVDYNRNLPLLQQGNGGTTDAILFQSLLTGHLAGLPSQAGHTINDAGTLKRIYFINLPVLWLYQSATGKAFNNRLLLEGLDTASFIRPATGVGAWVDKNSFCYELTHGLAVAPQQVSAIIINDLDSRLGLWGRWEERPMDVWAVSGQGTPVRGDSLSLTQLMALANSRTADGPLKPIIVDESDTNPVVPAAVLAAKADLPSLVEALKQQGFSVQFVRRRLQVFVLSKNPSPVYKQSGEGNTAKE